MTLQFFPTFSVLSIGFCFALFGGGVMFWMTRNWRAAAIVGSAGLITAIVWLLQGVFS